jgi:hypothetical protein
LFLAVVVEAVLAQLGLILAQAVAPEVMVLLHLSLGQASLVLVVVVVHYSVQVDQEAEVLALFTK